VFKDSVKGWVLGNVERWWVLDFVEQREFLWVFNWTLSKWMAQWQLLGFMGLLHSYGYTVMWDYGNLMGTRLWRTMDNLTCIRLCETSNKQLDPRLSNLMGNGVKESNKRTVLSWRRVLNLLQLKYWCLKLSFIITSCIIDVVMSLIVFNHGVIIQMYCIFNNLSILLVYVISNVHEISIMWWLEDRSIPHELLDHVIHFMAKVTR
jgi:hypothetical protein